MTAAVAKNLVGDLLANGAKVKIETDNSGGWIVFAEPSGTSGDVTAAQVNTLATRYTITATVPSARFV